jgi:hypothetical protein
MTIEAGDSPGQVLMNRIVGAGPIIGGPEASRQQS